LFQEKHDESSEKEKATLDDSSFEELERDFQEVTVAEYFLLLLKILYAFSESGV